MRLILEGEARAFIPIKTFRADHELPASFGVALFEPKDFTGLGSIDGAGAQLNTVREAVLNALPAQMSASDWLTFLPQLTALFKNELYSVNDAIHLHDVEIDFAAGGFGDVCHAFAYALLRARAESKPPPVFETVYGEWLNSTTRVSQTVYPYTHHEQEWHIHIVTHAYGRAGMIVATPAGTCYVHDATIGCPAEGFMGALLKEVTERIVSATV
jgi:hypothetical protein